MQVARKLLIMYDGIRIGIPGCDGNLTGGIRWDLQQAPGLAGLSTQSKQRSRSTTECAGLQQFYPSPVSWVIGMMMTTDVHINIIALHHGMQCIGVAQDFSMTVTADGRGIEREVPQQNPVPSIAGFLTAELFLHPVQGGFTDFSRAGIPADDKYVVHPVTEIKRKIAFVNDIEQGIGDVPIGPCSGALAVKRIKGRAIVVADGKSEGNTGFAKGCCYALLEHLPHLWKSVVGKAAVLTGNHVAGHDDDIGLHPDNTGYSGVNMPVIVEGPVRTI